MFLLLDVCRFDAVAPQFLCLSFFFELVLWDGHDINIARGLVWGSCFWVAPPEQIRHKS